jgi:hypothetical protein
LRSGVLVLSAYATKIGRSLLLAYLECGKVRILAHARAASGSYRVGNSALFAEFRA